MIEDQYPTEEELLLRAQDGLAREVDRVLDEAGSVRASLLGHKRPDHPPASVAGYRFMGLRVVDSSSEPENKGPANARHASGSEQFALWLTRDQLGWLGSLLGDQPYGLEPGQSIYQEISRALTMLAVLDAGKDER